MRIIITQAELKDRCGAAEVYLSNDSTRRICISFNTDKGVCPFVCQSIYAFDGQMKSPDSTEMRIALQELELFLFRRRHVNSEETREHQNNTTYNERKST